MQLRDDDAFSTVDDKRTILRHEGDLPHVNVLLLNIFDRF